VGNLLTNQGGDMKKFIILVICCLSVSAAIYYFYSFLVNYHLEIQSLANQDAERLKHNDVYLNIFVHGSFGTMLGMLSLPKIAQDEVKGTLYRSVIKEMRKDPRHFTEQPILNKGLIKITPTFDPIEVENKKLAVYPILKAYESMLSRASAQYQTNHFYTFGWTGLMSQTRRRLESIRFYNELSEELEVYHSKGVTPKIRIITHSHGGNLCLNLAAINKIIQQPNLVDITKWSNNQNENESLNEMYKLIKELPNKESAKQQAKMKKFDYLPSNNNFTVGELILLGSPIQPETEFLCTYGFFEKIYNFYSEKDYIQRMDFISTKQGYSSQRISDLIVKRCNQANKLKLIQARIMIERDWAKANLDKPRLDIPGLKPENSSILNQVLSSAQTYFSDETKDPTHKDLWFIDWGRENENIFAPVPIVVFVPLLLQTISQANINCSDFDINITKAKDNKYLAIQAARYNEFKKINEVLLPMKVVKEIKSNFKKWTPLENEKDTNLAALMGNFKKTSTCF